MLLWSECRAGTARGLRAVALAPLLILAASGSTATAHAQAGTHAEANQLHAAIANGDVDALKYWLDVRHASASAANAAEPEVTPIERCLTMAGRVLDAPPGAAGGSREGGAPVVGLRVLQDMVSLLHERGARLSNAERQRFSGPVLRWYDDAVSTPVGSKPGAATHAPMPPPSTPTPSAPAPSGPPASAPASGAPVVTVETAPVAITTNMHEACNGTGHVVYLANRTQLSATAMVTMYEDAGGSVKARQKRDRYTVDPASTWRLGCDTTKDGRRVRYVLNGWR